MATAYSYIRFSTRKQADGDSLRRQLQRTRNYCRDNGLELSEKNFRDLGVSAFKQDNKPSLDDLLGAIESNAIKPNDYIILENLDRLSRRGIDHTIETLRSILKHDVNVVDLTNNLELNRNSLNDLVSVIRIALAADLAYQESLKKSERVLAAKAQQRKDIREGKVVKRHLPFWLKRTEQGYELNELTELVYLIIEQRKKGTGFHKIAMMLNETDHKPPIASHWSDTTVRETVKSRALYGSLFDKDGEAEQVFPALISFTEWQSMQSSKVSSAGGYKKHNHLSRLVKCECGAAMSKKLQKSGGGKFTYNTWVCTASLSGGCTNRKVIRDLDVDVFKSLKHLVIQKSVDGRLDAISKKIEQKEERQKELEQALLDDDAPITALTTAIKKTQSELTELRSERDSMHIDTDSTKLYDLQDDAVQFNIELRKLVDKVEVIPVNVNMWRIKIHQHNGHVVSMVKSRKSQRQEWKRLFSKTETIANM